jgi:hypothetical protein
MTQSETDSSSRGSCGQNYLKSGNGSSVGRNFAEQRGVPARIFSPDEDENGNTSGIRTEGYELNERLDVLTDPVEDLGKAEFVPLHRADDECVSHLALDLDVKAIAPQEDIGGSEGDALVAVEKPMVIAERFHERGRFFFDGVVIAGLRTENSGLNRALIANTVEAAEQFDQSILHAVDFRYRKVVRHLLGETL